MVEATRYFTIVMYAVLAALAFGWARIDSNTGRRASALLVGATAIAWTSFYVAIAMGLWDPGTVEGRSTLTIASRFMHLFTFAMGVTYLNLLRVIRNEERRAARKLERLANGGT